jgi:hypothetical protein
MSAIEKYLVTATTSSGDQPKSRRKRESYGIPITLLKSRHRAMHARCRNPWPGSARVPRVLAKASAPSRTFLGASFLTEASRKKDSFGATPKPAREDACATRISGTTSSVIPRFLPDNNAGTIHRHNRCYFIFYRLKE